ncbi:MAG: hypothetical protein ABI832_11995, partial [bacterium]
PRGPQDVVTTGAKGISLRQGLEISQHGANTNINFSGETIVLRNVDVGALTAANFAFNTAHILDSAAAQFFDGWTYLV